LLFIFASASATDLIFFLDWQPWFLAWSWRRLLATHELLVAIAVNPSRHRRCRGSDAQPLPDHRQLGLVQPTGEAGFDLLG
jgi:hypothetical protein